MSTRAVVFATIAALAACGSAPRAPRSAAHGSVGPWSELGALPARAELAIAVADPAATVPHLADGRDLGGAALTDWLAPRFAGRSWPLDRLGDAGLDPHGPVAAARLDDDARTIVRTARVIDADALARVTAEAVRAAGVSPSRWRVGDVAILAAGDDALVVRGARAFFVSSGARSQRDRAAVEIAAGDGPVLADALAGPIAAVGPGAIAVASRGAATRELVATEKPTGAAVAALSRTSDALIARLAVTPAPDATQVELGLAVAMEPLPETRAPSWPARPKDENPDVPLSPAYREIAARLDALDAELRALAASIALAGIDRDAAVDSAFRARAMWQRSGAMAIADLRIALPGGQISTAIARAREATRPIVERRERAIARSREAIAGYERLVDELVRVRARDVAAHDQGR